MVPPLQLLKVAAQLQALAAVHLAVRNRCESERAGVVQADLQGEGAQVHHHGLDAQDHLQIQGLPSSLVGAGRRGGTEDRAGRMVGDLEHFNQGQPVV